MRTFLVQQLDYVYFVYGTVFLLLGFTCLIINREDRDRISWRGLGLFAILYGVKEWLDVFNLDIAGSRIFVWLSVAIGLVSIAALVEFMRANTPGLAKRTRSWYALAAAVLLVPVYAAIFCGLRCFDLSARYVAGIPAILGTAWVLWSLGSDRKSAELRVAAVAVALYGLSTAIVVLPFHFFPDSAILVSRLFPDASPVAVARILLSFIIAGALWARYLRALRLEGKSVASRLESVFPYFMMAGVVAVFVLGFALVSMVTHRVGMMMRYEFTGSAAMIATGFDDETADAVAGIPGNPASPAGRQIVRRTAEVMAVDRRITGISLIIFKGNAVDYAMSAGADGLLHQGRMPADTLPGALESFRTGQAVFVDPREGHLNPDVSVFVPLESGMGPNAGAVLGINRSAVRWHREIARERFLPIVVLGGVELLVLSLFFLVWRYRRKTVRLVESEETARQRLALLHFKDHLIENIESAIVTFDERGILTYVNPAAVAMLRYAEADEVVGKNILAFCCMPVDRDDQLRQIFLRGQWRGERELIRQDGTRLKGYIVCTRIRGMDGGPDSAVATIIDISEIKASEEALRESEEKFRTITAMACDGIVLADSAGRILFWNAAAEQITGYLAEEVIGRMPGRFIGDGAIGSPPDPGTGKTLEIEVRRRDGLCVPVELSLTAVKIRGQQYTAGIMRDITHRRQVELAIRENEQNLASIFRAIPAIVCLMEPKHYTLVDANDALVERSGYRREELIGKAPRDMGIGFISPDRERIWKEFEEHGVIRNRETRIMSRTSGAFDALISITGIMLQGEKYALIQILDISARKQAEEALRCAGEFLKQLINAVGDPLFVRDRQGTMILVNDAFCEFTGRRREEVIGKHAAALFSAEQWSILSAQDEDVFAAGCVRSNEERQVDALGTEHVFLTKKTRFLDPAGNAFLVGIVRDITVLKQAEEALRRSEARYRHLIDCASDVVWEMDENGVFTYISPQTKDFIGFSAEEMLHRTPFEMMEATEAQRVLKIFEPIAARQEAFHGLMNNIFHKDGHSMIFEISGVPIRDDGVFRGYRGTARDITERVRAEERLTRINECFLKFGPAYEDNIARLNELFGSFLGARFAVYNRFDEQGKDMTLVGKWPEDFVHCSEHQLAGHLCPDVVLGGDGALQVVHECDGMSGDRQDLCVKHYGIKTHIGQAVRFGGASVGALCAGFTREYQPGPQDIEMMNIIISAISVEECRHRAMRELELNNTALSELRRELSAMNVVLEDRVSIKTRQVKELLRQKDDFMNQLGHDLKTPLTPLVALLPLVREEVGSESGRHMLDVCLDNVEYMQALVFKALELFRIESATLTLSREQLNLRAEVQAALNGHAVGAVKSGIRMENLVEDGLFVTADALRLREVFSNLFENAVHYTAPGGTLIVSAQTRPGEVEVAVRDTGIGIAPEHLERIFDEFYKVDFSRHDRANVGLGLSICKKIVTLHGGRIWATSGGLGAGTTIHFTLPERGGENGATA